MALFCSPSMGEQKDSYHLIAAPSVKLVNNIHSLSEYIDYLHYLF